MIIISILNKIRRWYYHRQIRKAVTILKNVDKMLVQTGYSRHDRQQVWRNFYKHPETVFEFLSYLTRDQGRNGHGK